MKKIILLFLLSILVFSACEKDDFCVKNPVTPMLILRFYDDVNRETIKPIDNLYVWAEGIDKDTIFENASLDSLFIPLNSASSETVYNFSNGISVNTFTIQYLPEDEFVSRSCGFRVIFNDVAFSSNNTWIDDFTPDTLTTIDNQTRAHVKIYH